VANNKVELSFNGDQTSSDGGLLLLREAESRIHLIDGINSCITDRINPRYIDRTIKKLLTQRRFQIAAGNEYRNDCDCLSGDTVFKMCAERFPKVAMILVHNRP